MNKPIKRADALQPLSRDHHQGLLLCWKIRQGLSKGAEIGMIKQYTDWFYNEHIIPHFEMEELHLFPILGNDHELIKKALAEHRRLKRLFTSETDLENSLRHIESELDHHIRFEERVLFNEIERVAGAGQLEMIRSLHQDQEFCDNDHLKFW
jgi:hypothetical protein